MLNNQFVLLYYDDIFGYIVTSVDYINCYHNNLVYYINCYHNNDLTCYITFCVGVLKGYIATGPCYDSNT